MQLQPARRACICACNCNQLAAPVSAHATATSSLRLYLRMQLQPARRAQPVRAHRPPRPPCITITHLATAALHALRSTLRCLPHSDVRGVRDDKITMPAQKLRRRAEARASDAGIPATRGEERELDSMRGEQSDCSDDSPCSRISSTQDGAEHPSAARLQGGAVAAGEG